MEWNKIGNTHKDKYPDDGSKEVEFAVIKNGKMMLIWVGRNVVQFSNECCSECGRANVIEPTHWRYVC